MKETNKEELFEKQSELKSWIKKIGLSQKKFAERYYYDTEDTDIEEEVFAFTKKFNKQLNRDTTSIKLIETYLEYLYSLDEFKKLSVVSNKNTSVDVFEKYFNDKMLKLSKEISESIENDSPNITAA